MKASRPAGKWFHNNLKRVIGDGRDTSFWSCVWLGSRPLKDEFPRLFWLCEDRNATVNDMGKWCDGRWVWEVKWKCELREREVESVNSLMETISGFPPCAGKKDTWEWKADKGGVYSTNSAYRAIKDLNQTNQTCDNASMQFRKLWKAPATQKARMTAWRALKNRLPTCDNLIKRNVELGLVERSCTACFHAVESVSHTLILCPKTEAVWDNIYGWLGVFTARPASIPDHFLSFIHLGKGKKWHRFLKALWCCSIWVLWRRRNESRFDGKAWDIKSTCLEIKARMWSWNFIFGIFEWKDTFPSWCSCILAPFMCN
ncbi:uncharacterized protein LOC131025574 [Salvia miltiorrhiza]|uniref:uncharacterized protein LOC131025574 n=1 Tax=Salvia miltiorrhiza TaxID=226208 RepID=UPI0025ABE926|nr:uncharacterized protein LOC131025574 [Salvia miltiorrhiza]